MMEAIFFRVLLSIAVSLLIWLLLILLGYRTAVFGIGICCIVTFTTFLVFPRWNLTLMDTARALDRWLPELEESSLLFLKPEHELGPLEKLQAARIGARLEIAKLPNPFRKRLIISICLMAAAMLAWGFARGPHKAGRTIAAIPLTGTKIKILPAIQTIHIHITPPAYTGRPVRNQQDPNVQVEEGALINWEIRTNMAIDSLEFILSDSDRIRLGPADDGRMLWRWSTLAKHSGFYQLGLGGALSDLYRIEVKRDEAPRISISTPKPYTTVDIGEPRMIPLVVRVEDDYGVRGASLVATIASGSGEAVKFKEHLLPFNTVFSGDKPVYDLRQSLNLDALGVHPGDELYFYCKASDNHGAESRSDMFIISLPDTAKLMSLDGLNVGVNIKPELFRSQRQIIIETEQLLRGKDSISVQAFNDKSNDLGVDQKLLRLRYGKFLGEEAEEGGAGESFKKAGDAPADFGNAGKVLDAFTDKHDNAEDASYFEPAVKQQLKATLTEMWNAELRLRTFKPQDALPYEYKALRLLKDLQQKSRAFVAKTGVKLTPLDPDKRLKGALDGIGQPLSQTGRVQEPSAEDKLRMALSILDRGDSSGPSMGILMEAARQLGRKAADLPSEYLEGFQALKRILSGLPEGPSLSKGRRRPDVQSAQQAIRKMVAPPEANPFAPDAPADAGLSQLYFKKVNKP
jgi:hypothetical protein